MKTSEAIEKFRRACAMLREISENSHFEFYVAADALHLMSGPSHDEHCRPLRDNIVDSDSRIRISGGDW